MDIVDIFDPSNKDHLKAYVYFRDHAVWPKGFLPEGVSGCENDWRRQIKLLQNIADHYAKQEIGETYNIALVIDCDDDFAVHDPIAHKSYSYIRKTFRSPKDALDFVSNLVFEARNERHTESAKEWFLTHRNESIWFLNNFDSKGAIYQGGNWEWFLGVDD